MDMIEDMKLTTGAAAATVEEEAEEEEAVKTRVCSANTSFSPSSSSMEGASHVVETGDETTTVSATSSTANSTSEGAAAGEAAPTASAAAARVLEDDDYDEEEYEYEDDDAFVSGFIDQGPEIGVARNIAAGGGAAAASSTSAAAASSDEKPVKIEEEWREPSRQAIDMSLRAEKETSGGKRRLAQDLYRIMSQDTEAAGFDLEPVGDDMGKWRIRVFHFDKDSNLAKDMLVLNIPHIELEMTFPEHYPFEPPFVQVLRPRFKRQTGFVMSGAICMELLTRDGWNPVNDIESVIVSIRSLLVVGDGRLEAAANFPEKKYSALLAAAQEAEAEDGGDPSSKKRMRTNSAGDSSNSMGKAGGGAAASDEAGSYSASEAKAAYNHLSDYHKKKGWDTSGWWAKKG
jgi:ubiquitin-conjugating enzyme E2 Q